MTALEETPSQTVGPFFHDGLLSVERRVLVSPDVEGERIRIEGHVYDGDGAGVPDALVEIWQADAHGRYRHPADDRDGVADPAFIGLGRVGTDESGHYWFETTKPGRVPWDDEILQAPHVIVQVFARGLLLHVTTRLYFEDEDNTADLVLASVPEERRPTLVATKDGGGDIPAYRFDVTLQGAGETVFFDV
jgi:protocatechuate 3,4-dioxygenase, alpha subunit